MRTRPSPSVLVPLLRDQPDFSALKDPEQWLAVQAAAASHRMSAVIASAVRPHTSAEQRQWCDRILTESWTRHDRAILYLDSLLDLFETAGVEVLALKGPILGRRHYQPPFLRRTSVDVDLAVRDRDLEAAVDTLIKDGYTPKISILAARATSHHLDLSRPKSPDVELHTRLSKMSLGVPVEDLFTRAVDHQLPTGRVARIPCPTDELLGLFIHLAGDRFASFSHLYELRLIWRKAPADLRRDVLTAAARHRVSTSVWLAHVAVQAYWGEDLLDDETALPNVWLRNRLNPDFLHRLEQNATLDGSRGLAARLEGRWLDLHMTESALDAASRLFLLLRLAVRETLARRWGPVARPVQR